MMHTAPPPSAFAAENQPLSNPVFAGKSQNQSTVAIAVNAELDISATLSMYLTIYIEILDAVNNQDFPKMKLQLAHFKRVLTAQLTESFRTLLQLRKMSVSDTTTSNPALRFHNDLVAIGSKILPLLNRYDSRHVDADSIAGLLTDLTDVGEILMAA